MANVWIVAFIAVLTAPVDAPRNQVKSRTQIRPIKCPSDEVSPTFTESFLKDTLPVGLFKENSETLVYICQNPHKTYFSTLFDKRTMNPILSACKITWENALGIGEYTVRTNYWRANDIKGLYPKKTYDELYKAAKSMDKGHLNSHAINSFNKDYTKSTFVYTNAVPQYSQWNRGAWKEYEKAIRRYTQMTCGCKHRGTMYLMTGTSDINFKLIHGKPEVEKNSKRSPEEFLHSHDLGAGIHIPKSLWTAGCCLWTDEFKKLKAQSIAVMGNNSPDKGKDETTGMTLEDLEKLLGNNVTLFPDGPACRGNSFIIKVKYVDD
ncbi:uncharacterized protein LOC114950653 [Acropora millepora]|uniref:uncharacterized protein LOC114950653 n=1 Tax=Acropora millepora TaxID=45264 RepID=UPI001CF58462|nr:uncharacterized protein LOC114950653 [Acropora millepora]